MEKLRFKGFNKNITFKDLKALFIKGRSGGTPKSTNSDYYNGDIPFLSISDISKSNGYIYETEKHITKLGLKNSSAWVVPAESISLAMYASVGKVAILKTNAATSQAFYNMVFDNNITRNYVYQYLKYMEENHKWDKFVSTGTQSNLNAQKVKDTKIKIPGDLAEQNKIGSFLTLLDSKVSNVNKKIEQLQLLKKGYLQKMFPKKGEKFPSVRFKGFTDAWEQRELSELATFSKGSGYSKGDLVDNGSPIILYGRLYTKYETTISDVDTYVHQKSGSIISAGGEVIVPASGETAEDIAIASVVDKPGIILGGDLNVIHPKEMIESTFLAFSITYGFPHLDMAKRAQGKSVVHLHNSDLKKVLLSFPKKEEQLKISQYLMKLDSVITLHQRKYELLTKLKQGYMQRLFD